MDEATACGPKTGKPRYTCDGVNEEGGACVTLAYALDGDDDCRDGTASDESKYPVLHCLQYVDFYKCWTF